MPYNKEISKLTKKKLKPTSIIHICTARNHALKKTSVAFDFQIISPCIRYKAKSRKYRGMFEVNSPDKCKFGKRIGLNQKNICKSRILYVLGKDNFINKM